ncbi:Hydroxyacid-oxoacid transhydrogenase, mitochondrial [Holothuria leucospilota]|uniref:hydroxyacid-oxoacid transhydrogenase n=1 Tax=Holothuria leucospilota TaxID=206669 RepID=A0A9Q0YDX8_HOLLE|nr:Hydroxyacid-oxoacid transhydrogenase, mitochondrial [Holothuria leucospilota]
MASKARNIFALMHDISRAACGCPAHSQAFSGRITTSALQRLTTASTELPDYAFEMACSNIRFGAGVTQEVGMDFINLGAKHVAVVTDKTVSDLPIMEAVLSSLEKHHVNFEVYDKVRVEPTDGSFQDAINFARENPFDAFLAVGGGSAIDTCKTANLYACHTEAEFLDFVNAPIGKGLPITKQLKPLIAIPTTAGTGSETTGVAIFDYTPLKAKTGIAHRSLRPLLGIVDPLHTKHMPNQVAAYSGFDVLCHALESYTAIPYHQRTPRPQNPINRPAYQGSNPISDIWSTHALRILNKYFKRAVYDPEDLEARSQMHLASVFAGVGFGNAGVHLCHGMSYPISGMVKKHKASQYQVDHPLVPHGLSVVITAPAVFEFTAPSNPERHLEAAEMLGADVTNAKREDAGRILGDILKKYMTDMKIENGISEFGYTTEDIPGLVKGTIPQKRVTVLAPRPQTEEDLSMLFEKSMTVY